ncbi:MAG: polyprenyl synthetase family protein [Candidatus Omnitrophota bacterium]|jgi:geranylgeranyl diphosphate synthase type I
MLGKIKKRIDSEISAYFRSLRRMYPAEILPPILSDHIEDFVMRNGKRARPIFFILGYLGFSKKIPRGLYKSAVSVELLHNFVLIHDDIIDRSDTRRNGLSLHCALDKYTLKCGHIKHGGKDLALVAGDILYALGMANFLSVDVRSERKEAALKKLFEAAVYTGSGEFLELLSELKGLSAISKPDIYRIYDLKTGIYSFATPLVMGATLAGIKKAGLNRLYNYGICIGRAFQIKDDVMDIIGSKENDFRPPLTDLRESKRTILMWHAYNNADDRDREILANIIKKEDIPYCELLKMRQILIKTGAIDFAVKEIRRLIESSKDHCNRSGMSKIYRNILMSYCEELLKINADISPSMLPCPAGISL